MAVHARKSFFVPEVIQTSEMDCGPAALKCLLDGHGIAVSYGRLREACQTDVDGTSIDTLEEIAQALGLDAEQIVIPTDHVMIPEAEALPAIAVVQHSTGGTHFVVVWKRHGSWLQIMDPAVGRRWVSLNSFRQDLYVHQMRVDVVDWFDWAKSDDFLRPLSCRLKNLGMNSGRDALVKDVLAEDDWKRLAQLDAVTRFVESLTAEGGIRRGGQSFKVLTALTQHVDKKLIPTEFWSALPIEEDENDADSPHAKHNESLHLRGAVLVRVRGKRSDEVASNTSLNSEFAASVVDTDISPSRYLTQQLLKNRLRTLCVLLFALIIGAGAVVVEALLFRGIMEIGDELKLTTQRLGAAGYFFAFGLAILIIDWQVFYGLLSIGRRLEVGLRLDFLKKIPLISDEYFRSRPISDMAQRSHSVHNLRKLPFLGAQFVRTSTTLLVTTGAMCWLFPEGAALALLSAVSCIGLPWVFRRVLLERDLRVRTHAGSMSRFYLDVLTGLAPIRAHSAQRSVRREHERMLVEWLKSSRRFINSQVVLEILIAFIGFSLAAVLVFRHFRSGESPAGILLLAYWALQLPVLGEQLVKSFAELPFHRNLVLRAIEPLGTAESSDFDSESDTPNHSTTSRRTQSRDSGDHDTTGVQIELDSVTVRAAGHVILRDVNLQISGGEHVAIVGSSGSGKSTLVGLLLGWHQASSGMVKIDGLPLLENLDSLRQETAWVDPSVQLWNRSLVDNLLFGNETQPTALDSILRESDLFDVLSHLDEGLQSRLGGDGGLLSGGEGQRVRFGRALCRKHPRLVLLDEAFRGLEPSRRHTLLARARQRWKDATLLFVTHNLSETRDFPRVMVVDSGRVVEDATPEALSAKPDSRYGQLLEAEEHARRNVWNRPDWKQLRIVNGKLVSQAP